MLKPRCETLALAARRHMTEIGHAEFRPGDVLLFRSDLWHAGSRNRSAERSRYLLQIHYGRRMVAQKFSPYLHFRFNPEVLAAATPRQRRLLGEHEATEYD